MPRPRCISLVIPVYNEAAVIEKHVLELQEYVEGYCGEDEWEIVLVDDGSTDGTADTLDRLARDNVQCRAVHHAANFGRGRALRTGFGAARGDVIVTLDADLSYAPYHIEKMVQALDEQKVDIVLASAYHPEGSVANVPFLRLLISRFGNIVLSRAFAAVGRFHTWTCTVRAFRSSVVKSMDLISDDKELHLEVLRKASLLGFRIAEVPADLKWRETKLAKSGPPKKRKAKFSFGKTAKSHLADSFIYRRGPLFRTPMLLFFSVFLCAATTIAAQILLNMAADGTAANVFAKFVRAFSDAYRSGPASFYVGGIALLSFFQVVMLYLLTRQMHAYYVDLYSFLNRQCNRCKPDDGSGPGGGVGEREEGSNGRTSC